MYTVSKINNKTILKKQLESLIRTLKEDLHVSFTPKTINNINQLQQYFKRDFPEIITLHSASSKQVKEISENAYKLLSKDVLNSLKILGVKDKSEIEIVQHAKDLLQKHLSEKSYLLSVLNSYAETALIADEIRKNMMKFLIYKHSTSENEKKEKIEKSFFNYLFENWMADYVKEWNFEEQAALRNILKNTSMVYLKTNINPFKGRESCLPGEQSRTAEFLHALIDEDRLYVDETFSYSKRVYQTYCAFLEKAFDPENFLNFNDNIKMKEELQNEINKFIASLIPEGLKKFASEQIVTLPDLSCIPYNERSQALYQQERELLKRINDVFLERNKPVINRIQE